MSFHLRPSSLELVEYFFEIFGFWYIPKAIGHKRFFTISPKILGAHRDALQFFNH